MSLLSLDWKEIRKFSDKYFRILREDYSGINLTRMSSEEEFFRKQIMDSLIPLEVSEIFVQDLNEKKLSVDIGPGGGAPLLPLAFVMPNVQFVGIERRGKIVKVLNELAEKLGIKNVKVVKSSLGKVLFDRDCLLTIRAVGQIGNLLRDFHVDKKIKINPRLFFYKGPQFFKIEENDLMEATKAWCMDEKKSYSYEGVEGRWLIGLTRREEKIQAAGRKVKRKDKMIITSKESLSELIGL